MKLARWFALFIVLLSAPVLAQGMLKSQGKSAVKFVAVGPAGLKIEGTTDDLSLREDASGILVVVQLSKLDTGISLRNTHMREKYLETQKFPQATLSVASSAIKRPAKGATIEAQAPAHMTIHGVTKPVALKYTAHFDGSTYIVDGRVRLSIADFGISDRQPVGSEHRLS